jgi:hypothetical protein
MTCNFRVGQKVVRVSGNERVAAPAIYPEYGKVYTIRSINDWGGDVILICLNEIDNSHMVPEYGRLEPGFHYSAFRAVVERKTDISIFKAMLNPSKERADA